MSFIETDWGNVDEQEHRLVEVITLGVNEWPGCHHRPWENQRGCEGNWKGIRSYQRSSAMATWRDCHSSVSGLRTTICKWSRQGWTGKMVKTLSVGSTSSSTDSLADATRPDRVCFGFTLIKNPLFASGLVRWQVVSHKYYNSRSQLLLCAPTPAEPMNHLFASLVFSPSAQVGYLEVEIAPQRPFNNNFIINKRFCFVFESRRPSSARFIAAYYVWSDVDNRKGHGVCEGLRQTHNPNRWWDVHGRIWTKS